MHHTLCRDGEVLAFEGLLVITNDHEVVRTELVAGNWPSLAIDELDRSVVSVLREESDGLLARLDLCQQLPDVGALADVVGLACLDCLVGALVLLILDEAVEHGIVVAGVIILGSLFHLLHLLVGLRVHLHLLHHLVGLLLDAFWVLAGERWELRGVDHARRGLALDALASNAGCARSLDRLLVREYGQRVLCELDIGIEVVQTFVVRSILSLRGRGSHREDVSLPRLARQLLAAPLERELILVFHLNVFRKQYFLNYIKFGILGLNMRD